jgi:hypothetical protein
MHKVPMSRFFALVAVTERHDVLDLLLRQIGAAVLVGEEIYTAQLGHIDRKMAELKEQRAHRWPRAIDPRGKISGREDHPHSWHRRTKTAPATGFPCPSFLHSTCPACLTIGASFRARRRMRHGI